MSITNFFIQNPFLRPLSLFPAQAPKRVVTKAKDKINILNMSYNCKSNHSPLQAKSVELKGGTHHLNPYFITGFSDAECSFLSLVIKRPESRTGWRIVCRYQIGIHVKDLALLESIQSYFGGIGHIVKQGDGLFSYQVSSPKHISEIIIPHFEKYPLITKKKKEDFILFKEFIDMVKNC